MLKNSLFKIYKLNKILDETEKTDILTYAGLNQIKNVIENIILFGDLNFAYRFYNEIKFQFEKCSLNETESDTAIKILQYYGDIMEI